MYEYLAPDGKRYPADLPTLQEWARSGRIHSESILIHMDSGTHMPAGKLAPLQEALQFASVPPPLPNSGPNPVQPPPSRQQPSYPSAPSVPPAQPLIQKPWFILLMLIFIMPLGLIFLWMHPTWSRKTKGWATGVALLLLLIGSANSDRDKAKDSSGATTATSPADAKKLAQQEEANRKAAEKQEAAAEEAKRKAEQAVIAQKAKSLETSRKHFSEFKNRLSSVAGISAVVSRVEQSEDGDDVTVYVENSWHYEPKQIRLQAAQTLWEAWASIHSPDEPDKARIAIKDGRGNRVGGSGWLGGSMVGVDD